MLFFNVMLISAAAIKIFIATHRYLYSPVGGRKLVANVNYMINNFFHFSVIKYKSMKIEKRKQEIHAFVKT